MSGTFGRKKRVNSSKVRHNPKHDPKFESVVKIFQELKYCQKRRTRKAPRSKSPVNYEVYWSEKRREWTIIGIEHTKKLVGRRDQFSGFILVLADSGLVKTIYRFQNKTRPYFVNKLIEYENYTALRPKYYPVFEPSEVTLRETV